MEEKTTQDLLDGCRQQLASAEREVRALRARLEETEARTLDGYPMFSNWVEAGKSGALESEHPLRRIEDALTEIVSASFRGPASQSVNFTITPGAGLREPAQLGIDVPNPKKATRKGRLGMRWVTEHGELVSSPPAGNQTEIAFTGPKGRS